MKGEKVVREVRKGSSRVAATNSFQKKKMLGHIGIHQTVNHSDIQCLRPTILLTIHHMTQKRMLSLPGLMRTQLQRFQQRTLPCRLTKHERNADRASLKEQKQLQRDMNIHTSRLNNLLSANGFRRVDVPSDGNCFFEACAITIGLAGTDIRKCLSGTD